MSVFRRIKKISSGQRTDDDFRPLPHPHYASQYNEDGKLPDQFYYNLNRTIAWTQRIVESVRVPPPINYAKVLRSINPQYEGKLFYTFDKEKRVSPPEIEFNYAPILFHALSLRREKLGLKRDIYELGKILRFQINITTVDGAPVENSEGFVDFYDIPPIDTWFYITKKYLYCWIPTMFVSKMQDAIDVEILDSYAWLEEINPELNYEILRRVRSEN